jgi:hypothetical protein
VDWTTNININDECIEFQKQIIHVETLIKKIQTIGIVVKNDGTILVSDNQSDNIHFYNKNGSPINLNNGMQKYINLGIVPGRMAITANDDIIITNIDDHSICYIDKDYAVRTIAGGTIGYADGNGTNAKFNLPSGIAINTHGTIYISDFRNNCIRAISTNGDVTTIAGAMNNPGIKDDLGIKSRFDHPRGIAVMKDQTIIVVDSRNHCIRAIDIHGMVRTIAGSTMGYADGNGILAKFDNPYGVAIMEDQTIIITDTHNNCIRAIDINYDVKTIAGSKENEEGNRDGFGTNTRFNHPTIITMAPDNSIIIADYNNQTIRRLYYHNTVRIL